MPPEGYYDREQERRRIEILETERLIHRLELAEILTVNKVKYSLNYWN